MDILYQYTQIFSSPLFPQRDNYVKTNQTSHLHVSQKTSKCDAGGSIDTAEKQKGAKGHKYITLTCKI